MHPTKPTKPTTQPTFAEEFVMARDELATAIEAVRAGLPADSAAAETLAQVGTAFAEFANAAAPTDMEEFLTGLPVEMLINECTRRVHEEGAESPYMLMVHELAHADVIAAADADAYMSKARAYATGIRNEQPDTDDGPSMERGWNRD